MLPLFPWEELYVLDKLSESGAVVVRTAVTVINVELAVQKTVALCIIFQHGFLCADTHALVVRAVIFGKPAI